MPDFYDRNGTKISTEIPAEAVRLRARGYSEGKQQRPADARFHPGDKSAEEVKAYLASVEGNKPEHDRVIAEEKGGQARVSIVGKRDEG